MINNKKIITFIIFLSLITSVSAYEIEYVHQDHLGNNIAITNQEGNVVWKSDYEPFGSSFNEEGNNNYKYNNKELDSSTDLLYYGARYYDSDIGRFTTADTVAGSVNNPQSLNRYAYVQNNPMKYVDPTGNVMNAPQEVVGWMNELTGGDYFLLNDEGSVMSGDAYFEGSEVQKKLYSMFNKIIDSSKIVGVGLSRGGISSAGPRISIFNSIMGLNSIIPNEFSIVLNINSNKNLYPLGEGGALLKRNVQSVLAHESAHIAEILSSGTSTESTGVEYENYAREAMGLNGRRIFYGFEGVNDREYERSFDIPDGVRGRYDEYPSRILFYTAEAYDNRKITGGIVYSDSLNFIPIFNAETWEDNFQAIENPRIMLKDYQMRLPK